VTDNPESGAPGVAEIRSAAENVAVALEAAGFARDAATVRSALGVEGSGAEWLLAVREALVVTRPRWQSINDDASNEAARSLAAAKRLAIEL
jgi:hypothetical protein